MDNLETFRTETREWLEANYPESLKAPMRAEEAVGGGRKAKFINPDSKVWMERMGAKGWTMPQWPKEYGGGGLDKEETKVLNEELARLKCRPALGSMGMAMLGPAILLYGSEEVKKEHLPKIVRGEISWCQGYSEPGAGSDLAGLSCRADEDGDDYIINGSKIWTSNADNADWIFSLVRTDPQAGKRDGISLILIDMDEPGVTISPIVLISGYSVFFETNFENVRVPKKNIVGEVNKGWTVAKYLLTHERTMIAGTGGRLTAREKTLAEIAKDYVGEENGRVADPVLRDQIAQQEMDEAAMVLTTKRYGEQAKAGEGPGAVSSMFKYTGTHHAQNRLELMVAIRGTQALGWEGEGFSDGELLLARGWLRSKGYSIEGGTSEIMLNIVSKRVLGLPG